MRKRCIYAGHFPAGGQPVSGAIVTLVKRGMEDATGSDGAYAFSKTSTAISPPLIGCRNDLFGNRRFGNRSCRTHAGGIGNYRYRGAPPEFRKHGSAGSRALPADHLIAPTHSASEADHTVFLDILSFVEKNLRVDSTRIFSTGYSHGGMMTYSLATKQQKKLRAAAGIAAANFNVWLPNPKPKDPIAYMGITGMYDEICIWDGGGGRGAKYIALEKAGNNGCTVASDVPHWTSGNHFTYEYKGCKPGYPVVIATFNGKHGGAEANKNPGASSSWVPKEIWGFFTQF